MRMIIHYLTCILAGMTVAALSVYVINGIFFATWNFQGTVPWYMILPDTIIGIAGAVIAVKLYEFLWESIDYE